MSEIGGYELIKFSRADRFESLADKVSSADVIIHLAGVNRPNNDCEFQFGNKQLTSALAQALTNLEKTPPIIFSSSIQVTSKNAYGESKLEAENILLSLSHANGNPLAIYRFPGIFGKWCRPNYNSVIATFCFNIARNLPVRIDDAEKVIPLVFVDDVVNSIVACLRQNWVGAIYPKVDPEYSVTLGEIKNLIESFKMGREDLSIESVGNGFIRALYSTYISYLPRSTFMYPLPSYKDERGLFVEMLKSKDAGQISFFTINPGKKRGSHYHHIKTEKFLVVRGHALFKSRNMITNEEYSIELSDEKFCIVDSIPGCVHEIINIGANELLVMLWANEVFDHLNPDTFSSNV